MCLANISRDLYALQESLTSKIIAVLLIVRKLSVCPYSIATQENTLQLPVRIYYVGRYCMWYRYITFYFNINKEMKYDYLSWSAYLIWINLYYFICVCFCVNKIVFLLTYARPLIYLEKNKTLYKLLFIIIDNHTLTKLYSHFSGHCLVPHNKKILIEFKSSTSFMVWRKLLFLVLK